jgi:hypothetical protein
MSETVSILHPRKLYAMLRACPSRDERARASFEFLLSSLGASHGFLFLRNDDRLTLAASAPNTQPPPGLVEQVELTWERELDSPHDDNKTKTLDVSVIKAPLRTNRNPLWQGANGEVFEHRVLSTYRGAHWVPVGLAAFERHGEASLLRQAHVESLCNAFLDAGDVPATTPRRP